MVSILMPVFNAAPYLEACLQSVLDQTYIDWELLAVNDYSIDESWNILERYAALDSRIHIFQNTQKGIIPALRLAYRKSTGTLITRMDADDLMAKHKLATLKNLLIANGIGHVATGLVEYFSVQQLGMGYQKYAAWLNRLSSTATNFKEIYKECVIPSPCWMVHRSDLDQIGAFQPNIYPEDYDLVFRMYAQQLKVVAADTVLHFWRDHPDRTSRTDENYQDNRFLALKLHYFLRLDHRQDKTLVLWGAGKKGKWVAKQLIRQNIPFRWVCNQPTKWGKHIYGVEMQSFKSINQIENIQVLILVASPDGQREIRQFFEPLTADTYYFA